MADATKAAPKARPQRARVTKSTKPRPSARARKEASDSEESNDPRERFVVLLRHGIAEDHAVDKPDEERSLTADGHARMKQIARGLERLFPRADLICASPLLRAMQTALWVSKGYRSRVKVTTTDALKPGSDPAELKKLIASMPERRPIFVGHEPTLTAIATALLGIADARLELKKGGAYGIRIETDGSATLEWMLSPKSRNVILIFR